MALRDWSGWQVAVLSLLGLLGAWIALRRERSMVPRSEGPEVQWRTVAADFEPEPPGALRDIYVHDATPADWQAALDYVRATCASLEVTVDGEPAALPAAVAEVFPLGERAPTLLTFDVGGIGVACHFFAPTEIEFDLRPEAVTGPERLAAVVAFLRGLALAVRKPAVLTMENSPESVILRADPVTGRVSWSPPAV